MNLTAIRILRWLLDALLAVWFFVPVKAQVKPTIARRALGILCLAALVPIYLFNKELTYYWIRFLLRTAAYICYLRAMKGLSLRRCIYYALFLWLGFNICTNIFLSTDLRQWFFPREQLQLLGTILVLVLYIVIFTLYREAVPFSFIPEPGGLRIGFALLLAASQLFIREIGDEIDAGHLLVSPSMSFYLLATQLLLGVTLIVFERYQSSAERTARDRITRLSNEYRYQSTIAQNTAAEEVRRLHHDMKNHLLAIQELSGDNDRLSTYLHGLVDELGVYEWKVETGNALLNGLISEKIRTAEKDGIDLSVQLDFKPCNDKLEDIDICVIFGNLLDNAIEACRKVPDAARRSILVKSRQSGGNMIINISNFYEEDLKIADGLPVTTKEDRKHHGIGLNSVIRSLEKYGGVLTFRTTPERRMILTILLPLDPKAT